MLTQSFIMLADCSTKVDAPGRPCRAGLPVRRSPGECQVGTAKQRCDAAIQSEALGLVFAFYRSQSFRHSAGFDVKVSHWQVRPVPPGGSQYDEGDPTRMGHRCMALVVQPVVA